MGNNNSNYGNGHLSSKSRHLPHDYHHRGHGKWGASNSDLGESSGNRMKKGYLPTRGYHGHHARPSPHKVLPSVNPTSAAKLLKPTSNGAILHQGGTISGRKLLSELDPHSPEAEDLRRAMRKRSTASCPGNGDMLNPNSGRSTPNLSIDYNGGMAMERNGPRRASSKGGSSRDYDSEPDLRDIDDNPHQHSHHRDDSSLNRSISPVPNSFTLIQESPAKKQIRTKKKGKAPPPPISPGDPHPQLLRVGGGCGELPPCCSPHSPQLLSPCGESKKASRLFKTKAESRLAASCAANGPRSPEICSDLEMSRGGLMRASMDANRFFRGERDRSSLHSAVEAGLGTPKTSAILHGSNQIHLSNRKHSEGGGGGVVAGNGVALRKASLGSAMLSSNNNKTGMNSDAGLSSRNNPEVKSKMMSPLARDHVSASSSAPLSKIATTSAIDEHVPKSHRVSNIIPPLAPYGQSSSNNSNSIISGGNGKPSVNQKVNNSNNNKGFISSSPSQSKTVALHQQNSNNSSSSSNNNRSNSKPILPNGKVVGGSPNTTANNNNVHHGRRKATAAPAVPTSTNTTVTTNANNNNRTTANANCNNVSESGSSTNKTMFYFGMDAKPPPPPTSNNNGLKQQQTVATVHRQSDSDNNNNECRLTMLPSEKLNERMLINQHRNHNHVEKVSSTNSSELLQIKQDSGSFDTNEKEKNINGNLSTNNNNRESSSELSSSDLDIPLNIRPTLPAKKLGLPRFSPTAAWRALDSPSRVSVSGRSYSSEEGYGHDRIQRYMRQIPPSRAHNHERSAGDSGISAGDAGSPANPELLGDQSTTATNTPSSGNPAPPPPIMARGGGGQTGYKSRGERPPTGKHFQNGYRDSNGTKCWTPEQDLDESSSSDYEDPPMSPTTYPHPISNTHQVHHSNSNVATRVLPAGLATPPKLTTRHNLFERGRNSALGMVSDSSDRPGNQYVRSRKGGNVSGSGNGGNGGSNQATHEEMMKNNSQVGGIGGASRYYRNTRNQPWRQPNHLRHPGGKNGNNANGDRDFLGLDTNWFLSRSEPNSLNLIGNGEYDNIEQQELRTVLAEQDDDDEDDVDIERDTDDNLFLPNSEGNNNKQRTSARAQAMMNNMAMNMHDGGGGANGVHRGVSNEYDEVDGSCAGVGGAATSTRPESEIGYGPSSMNLGKLSSPLPSPSAVKINRNKANRRQMNNNKEPPHHHQHRRTQLVSSTTLLSEEFEREQNQNGEVVMLASPSGQSANVNVRYGDNNNSWNRKPFSHIMYLPAYDSRRASSSAGTRRTKSVDNLNFSEMTLYQPRKTSQNDNPISPRLANGGVSSNRQYNHHHPQHQHHGRSRSPPSDNNGGRGRRQTKRSEQVEEPYERSQSVPPFTAEEENERRQRMLLDHQQQQNANDKLREREQEEEREQRKKKFKFQSTLRVLERKKIEEQLSREAEEKERRRLQEQEQMRRVEEEFQRKRVREKVLELEAAAAAAASTNNNGNKSGKAGHLHLGHTNSDKIEASNRYDVNFEPRNTNSMERSNSHQQHQQTRIAGGGGNSGRSSNISYTTTTMSNNHHQAMFQRQEPEGAPASNSNGLVGDLRKELICASRNRSGFPGSTKHSELTQELSEFCTPGGKRQYFDYRRAHHDDYLRSGPTTRYYNSSSSSDIFPVTNRRERRRGGGGSSVISTKSSVGYLRPTVHPQVVCDIPVKPLPYVVNFSRLSSSNMDLFTESERPRSGLGGNSSVLSDNYRKDWAHHNNPRGSNGPARASSVISLHSAPLLSNAEHFRHSSVDLTGGSVLQTPPQSPRQSKYSSSPSASPISHSSPDDRYYPNHANDFSQSNVRMTGVSQDMWNGDCITGNKTVVMLNSPSTSSGIRSSSPTPYQPAPAPFNRQKAFRPVDFHPSGNSSGGLSPAHAFHHASAKLTTPTPVS